MTTENNQNTEKDNEEIRLLLQCVVSNLESFKNRQWHVFVKRLRYHYVVAGENTEEEYEGWSFKYINDLRPGQDVDRANPF